jgi:Ca2+-binding RTX toxin-like protein
MSATVVVGPAGEEGVAFPYNFLANALFNPTISLNMDNTQATITPDQQVSSPGFYDVVIGTNLNNPQSGIVTGFTSNDPNGVEYTASGLSLSVGQIEAAIQTYQSDHQAGLDALQAIFSTVDWQIDFSDQTVGSEVFGTGGDDVITLGSGQDLLMIDGGSDQLDAGGGNDFIYAGTLAFSFVAGTSTVTGGDGNDTFCLDYREFGDNPQAPIAFFTTGQKVDLSKPFTSEETVVILQSVENLRGSQFADQLTGDDNANKLTGEEGKDKLIGKGGADILQGGADDDKLTGGALADKLSGGAGKDTFIFTDVSDSSAKHHDVIADFHHKQDKIDLRHLHPGTNNDKFVFIDDHKLKHAGDVQVIEHDHKGKDNDFTTVTADLDAKGHHQLVIELIGLVHLDAKDFML